MEAAEIIRRIQQIDTMFDNAKGWGSWMASSSSERRELVEQLRAMGLAAEHKHEMKAGGRVVID
jgi:hypothetical protein